ncbi:MAG: FAD-dependent oxidoreductase [Phototrophicales bacterium]
MKHILILGGGYAGMMAALRLTAKLHTHNDDIHITLINASDTFTERIRLHQAAVGKPLPQYSIPKMLAKRNIQFIQGWVTAIDPNQHRVHVKIEKDLQIFHYDILIYALGSHTDLDSIPGIRDYAYTLDEKSAQKLKQHLPHIAAKSGELVVCGGGLTGIETATELAEHFPTLHVRLVTQGQLGSTLSAKGRRYILETFSKLNIQLNEHVSVRAVNHDAILLDNGHTISYDILVWAGSFSAPKLAKQVGITVNNKNQILIDQYLRSISHPNIFVVGDSGQFVSSPEATIRMACATAMPMGARGGENVAALIQSKPLTAFHFNYLLQCISLGRRVGLIQFVHGDDTPKERILTGKIGAWVKELVCRFTIWALKIERYYPGIYQWAGAKRGNQIIHYEHEQSYRNV